MNQLDSLVQREAQKRDRVLGPEDRWRWIEQAIAWSDTQRPVSRATPAACKANEAKHLGPTAIRPSRPPLESLPPH
jgi:hypothetical protein